MTRISLSRIRDAAAGIDPVFLRTPQYECEPLSSALGASLQVKVESLNPIRSFKGRGASWFVAGAPDGHLVCATAGNFGQAMAHACRAAGRPLTVFAATAANPLKVARMRAMGADVRLGGANFDAAKDEARRWCEETGARFVEDGRDPAITEGAGTIGLEMCDRGGFDSVVVPLGNGALISGVGRAVRELVPGARVVGVCSEGADAMHASWRAGRPVERSDVRTVADGIAVRVPVPEALDDMRDVVDDVVLVSEESLLESVRLLHGHAGLVAEPAGVAGVAALLEHADLRAGRPATIVCGGNLAPDLAARVLVHG